MFKKFRDISLGQKVIICLLLVTIFYSREAMVSSDLAQEYARDGYNAANNAAQEASDASEKASEAADSAEGAANAAASCAE